MDTESKTPRSDATPEQLADVADAALALFNERNCGSYGVIRSLFGDLGRKLEAAGYEVDK